MASATLLKMLFALSICALAAGKWIETEPRDPDDIMIKDGVHHRASPMKRAAEKMPCRPLPRAVLEKIMGAAFNPRYMSFDKPEAEDALSEALPAGQKDQAYLHKKSPPLGAFHVHQGFSRILDEEPIMDYYINHVPEVGGVSYRNRNKSGFAVTQKPPMTSTVGHRRRHHHSRATSVPFRQDGQSGQGDMYGQSGKKSKNKAQLERIGQSAKYKMDDFEQGEPPAESNIESTSMPNGQQRELSASEKFVKSVREKRTVKSGFPWACESKIEWVDLGANHFPRFLRSVVCSNEKCWFGHFQCRPKAFTVKVLRRRKDSCSPEPSKGDEVTEEDFKDENSFVPPEFREQWVFEERAVTFCCECAA